MTSAMTPTSETLLSDGAPQPPAHDELADLGPGRDVFSVMELSERCAELEIRLDVAESERWHARGVLMALPQPVVVVDPFGEVLLLSRAAAQTFGLDAKYGGYPPLAEVVLDAQFADAVLEVIAISKRGTTRRHPWRLPTVFGMRNFDATIVCLAELADGRPSPWGAMIALAEIAAADDTTAAQTRAETLSALVNELRVPLSALAVQAELLRDPGGLEPSDRSDVIEKLAHEPRRLLKLLEDLQLLARIDAGQATGRRDRFSLAATVRDAVAQVSNAAGWRGVHLSAADIPPGDAVVMLGDRSLLGNAFTQTLSAIVAATPPGEAVRIAVEVIDSGKEAVVVLSAPGSLRDQPPASFPKGILAATANSGAVPALLRGAVEKTHRGRVSLDARPGHLVRLTIHLPLGPSAPERGPTCSA
jgi:signal transduction histidine kinase